MSGAWIRGALAAAFLLVTAVASMAVRDNERVLAEGRIVLAELAPVDPRSLMQGDYMALRYAVDAELMASLPRTPAPPPDYAHLVVDEAGRAAFAGTGDETPSAPNQVAMKIRSRDGGYSIGPNAFFFQEGTADVFAGARWGEFRVDPAGKALLTHLRDENLQRLGEIRR